MDGKHTPGPWRVEPNMGAQPGAPLQLCFHTIEAGDDVVASTWGQPHIANAHLIAAAPDLLEALTETIEAALRQLSFMGKGKEPSPNLQAAIDKGCAAIAKAEGRS